MTVVLGLDLSITATGWCVGGTTYGGAGAWTHPARHGDARLVHLRNDLRTLIANTGTIDLAVIEDLPTHAHGAGITGMVHGALRPVLIARRIPYALVTPATLKKYATGNGNCPKPDMRMALYKRTGIDLDDDNAVDAWWLCAAGREHLGEEPIALPAPQRAALAKVTWPRLASAATP